MAKNKFSQHEDRSITISAEEAVRRILDIAFMSEAEVTYEAYGSVFTIPLEKKFADVPSMQLYVNQLLQLDWVKELWPEKSQVPIVIREKLSGNRFRASYEMKNGTAEILIPPHLDGGRKSWAMRETLLLHEVAHHFARGVHGEEFVSTLVEFIGRLIGPYVGLLYQIEVSKARDEIVSRRKG